VPRSLLIGAGRVAITIVGALIPVRIAPSIDARAKLLHPESKTRPDIGRDELVWYTAAHTFDEVGTGAMHRQDDVGLQLRELGNCPLDALPALRQSRVPA
jgi:hypothetical protein